MKKIKGDKNDISTLDAQGISKCKEYLNTVTNDIIKTYGQGEHIETQMGSDDKYTYKITAEVNDIEVIKWVEKLSKEMKTVRKTLKNLDIYIPKLTDTQSSALKFQFQGLMREIETADHIIAKILE